jgi:hypothetical protein
MLCENDAMLAAMRRAVLLVLGSIAATGLAFACGDDGDSPAATSDAGRPNTSVDPSSDGGTGDGAVAGSVKVTVIGAAGPKAGLRVIFHDEVGAVIDTKLTDQDGNASITGTLPHMASVVLSNGTHLVTWVGVENGDVLSVEDPEPANLAGTPLGKFGVTVPAAFTGADRYVYYASGCRTAVTPELTATVPYFAFCARSPGTVLVRAQNGASELGYAFKKGNPLLTDAGTQAIQTSAWAPTTRFEIGHQMGEFTFSELLEISDNIAYRSGRGQAETFDLAVYPVTTGLADELQVTVQSVRTGAMLIKRIPPASRVEFAPADLLPAISRPSIDTSNPKRPILAWASKTNGTDGGMVFLSFGPNGVPPKYKWTLIVPPGTNRVEAPAMPPELDNLWSTDGGTVVYQTDQLIFAEADVIGSYADFRRQPPLAPAPRPAVESLLLALMPSKGYYRVMQWRP